jgi:hypothetical protein
MQVFISWSGPQANAVAEGLKDWLPRVLAQKVSCFVSSSDIESGQRGLNVIAEQLEQSEFGIVVVTPDNLEKPWINFEAGALSKAFRDHAQVAPLLVGLAEQDVKQPLAQFQMRSATGRESVLQLVLSVNRAQSEPVDEETVKALFGLNWSAFEELVATARAMNTDEAPRRGTEDILEEVLGTVRGLQRQVNDLRYEVAGPGPIPLSEQKVSSAVNRAIDYIKMMKLDLNEACRHSASVKASCYSFPQPCPTRALNTSGRSKVLPLAQSWCSDCSGMTSTGTSSNLAGGTGRAPTDSLCPGTEQRPLRATGLRRVLCRPCPRSASRTPVFYW